MMKEKHRRSDFCGLSSQCTQSVMTKQECYSQLQVGKQAGDLIVNTVGSVCAQVCSQFDESKVKFMLGSEQLDL